MLTSDRFGEFQSLFRMPLAKIEELTDILISRGYIKVPRSYRFREEFREHSELLMMSALYRLGNGNLFHQLRSMCHISISEMHLFFFDFVNVMVEMKDEFFFCLETLQNCARRASAMRKLVFLAAVGQWTLYTSSGRPVLLGTTIALRVRCAIPLLLFSASKISIAG
jgi:hypothetical protein